MGASHPPPPGEGYPATYFSTICIATHKISMIFIDFSIDFQLFFHGFCCIPPRPLWFGASPPPRGLVRWWWMLLLDATACCCLISHDWTC